VCSSDLVTTSLTVAAVTGADCSAVSVDLAVGVLTLELVVDFLDVLHAVNSKRAIDKYLIFILNFLVQ
jgi:hypothetical protein